jgi:cysteine desulfuration protein SufE
LSPLDPAGMVDNNLIKGCQSKVWLVPEIKEGKIYFHADSNTEITKGLISLLIRIFNGQLPDDIVNTDLFFINKIGMDQMIGSQRSNGFSAMIKQMKLFALTLGTLERETTND